MTFAEKMKELRKSKGKSQEQVSKEIGIAISSLRNYENGRLPDTFQLKQIKDYYGVTYEYLLDDNCENKSYETLNIGNLLNLTDNNINKIKQLNEKLNSDDFHYYPILFNFNLKNSFNTFIENTNLLEICIDITNIQTMVTDYIHLNILYSISFFKDYLIKYIKIKNHADFDNLLDIFIEISKTLKHTQGEVVENIISNFEFIKELRNDVQSDDYQLNGTDGDLNETLNEIIEDITDILHYIEHEARYHKYNMFENIINLYNNLSIPFNMKNNNKKYKFIELKDYYQYLEKDILENFEEDFFTYGSTRNNKKQKV